MDRSPWMMKALVSATIAAFIFVFVAGVALKIKLAAAIAAVLCFLTFGLTSLIYARSLILWMMNIQVKMFERLGLFEKLGLDDRDSPPKPVSWPFSVSTSIWLARAIGIIGITLGLVLIWLLIKYRAE